MANSLRNSNRLVIFPCYFTQLMGENLSQKEVQRSCGFMPSSPSVNKLKAQKLSAFINVLGKHISGNMHFRETGLAF